jgi:hypothetical protein
MKFGKLSDISNVNFQLPDDLIAPELAFYLFKQVHKNCEVQTRGPDLNIHKGGEQISLF